MNLSAVTVKRVPDFPEGEVERLIACLLIGVMDVIPMVTAMSKGGYKVGYDGGWLSTSKAKPA